MGSDNHGDHHRELTDDLALCRTELALARRQHEQAAEELSLLRRRQSDLHQRARRGPVSRGFDQLSAGLGDLFRTRGPVEVDEHDWTRRLFFEPRRREQRARGRVRAWSSACARCAPPSSAAGLPRQRWARTQNSL